MTFSSRRLSAPLPATPGLVVTCICARQAGAAYSPLRLARLGEDGGVRGRTCDVISLVAMEEHEARGEGVARSW